MTRNRPGPALVIRCETKQLRYLVGKVVTLVSFDGSQWKLAEKYRGLAIKGPDNFFIPLLPAPVRLWTVVCDRKYEEAV
jgi:hypothetical protein